jgi:hypothetical protein
MCGKMTNKESVRLTEIQQLQTDDSCTLRAKTSISLRHADTNFRLRRKDEAKTKTRLDLAVKYKKHTLVDLRKYNYTRKFCFGVIRDGRVKDKNP